MSSPDDYRNSPEIEQYVIKPEEASSPEKETEIKERVMKGNPSHRDWIQYRINISIHPYSSKTERLRALSSQEEAFGD